MLKYFSNFKSGVFLVDLELLQKLYIRSVATFDYVVQDQFGLVSLVRSKGAIGN